MNENVKRRWTKSKSVMATLSSIIAILGFFGIKSINDLSNQNPEKVIEEKNSELKVSEERTDGEKEDDNGKKNITNKPQEIIKSEPIKLVDQVENVKGSAYNSVESTVKDTFGNEYKNCIISRPMQVSKKSKIMYDSSGTIPLTAINNNFDYLNGTIIPIENFNNNDLISVEIYNENQNLLYKTDVSRDSAPHKVNIKITGSKKIYFMILSPRIELSYIGLADMMLK